MSDTDLIAELRGREALTRRLNPGPAADLIRRAAERLEQLAAGSPVDKCAMADCTEARAAFCSKHDSEVRAECGLSGSPGDEEREATKKLHDAVVFAVRDTGRTARIDGALGLTGVLNCALHITAVVKDKLTVALAEYEAAALRGSRGETT